MGVRVSEPAIGAQWRPEPGVRIDNLEVIDSALPRRQLRLVLAWAELHQEELVANWRRARAG
jgi:hypothetical protein